MTWWKHFIIVPLFFSYAVNALSDDLFDFEPEPLELVATYPLEGVDNLEPSGLAVYDNQLLMVSDTKNYELFVIEPKHDIANVKVWRNFKEAIPSNLIGLLPDNRMDWEGLTVDENQRLYLISEASGLILRLDKQNQHQWIDANIYDHVSSTGLFSKFNARAEGIASFPPNGLVVAAEREPRGLVTLRQINNQWQVTNYKKIESTKIKDMENRNPDFADIMVMEQKLYTLERNSWAVCLRDIESFVIENCWSYKHVELSPANRYEKTYFGIAEGLAVWHDFLYIVFDNNRQGRINTPKDKRPLLLKLALPSDW